MSFFSPQFFGFVIVILVLYYLINPKYQKVLLFLASSVFIGTFSIVFLVYTYLFVIINYILGLLVEKSLKGSLKRRIFYLLGIYLNIGILVFFKYINFLLLAFIQLFGIFNVEISSIALNILFPLGISYYVFQGIGYLIQINRGLEILEKDIFIYSNYYVFFPKFLAGPIELSKNFIPQLRMIYEFDYENVIKGFRLILWGAFKKLVIADRLAYVINGVYPNLESVTGNVFLFTLLLQPLQLYFDFSGYTDMALGIGRAFGFKLNENFRRPFFSSTVTEFWKRWHISLINWCKEFIFIRLVHNKLKLGIWASVYAVFITFLIIGIWHGPRWNFIILGLLQGVVVNYEYFTRRFRSNIGGKLPKKLVLYSSYLMVYIFFGLTLVFFNAVEVSDAAYFISHLFKDIDITDLSLMYLNNFDKAIVLIGTFLVLIVEFRQENGKDVFERIILWPRWARYAFYYILIFFVIYFGSSSQEFVYMQF